MEYAQIALLATKLKENISKVMVSKEDQIELLLVAMLSGGHVLLEDVPGTGKTVLIKSLAASVSCEYKRIQFTPDLLPSDITGVNFFNMKKSEFEFVPGPIFANIVLADEINRATPKTQSGLLECMEEIQATIDGKTFKLAQPFMVIATQNPVESMGTFPLPEAQLDRFFMKLSLGYPGAEMEKQMLTAYREASPLEALAPVCSKDEILQAQQLVSTVKVSAPVAGYMVALAEKSRSHEKIRLGISPRGVMALMRASQAKAAVEGRDFVLPDDVKAVFADVCAHRIICRGYQMGQADAAAKEALADILNKTAAPVER